MKQRADGRWQKQKTINGKIVYFYSSEKNEKTALKDIENQMLHYQEVETSKKKNLLLNKWIETWLYTYKEPDVKATTFITSYLRPCKNYIMPYFEGWKIRDITQIHIKAFLNSHAKRSQSLLDKIVICLNGIFETAIDNDIINKNPCRNVSAKSKTKKGTKRTYDKESVDALCSIDHQYSLLAQILLKMGLRCSELCGLKWENIDFNNQTMTIDQALTSEGARIFIDETKTNSSKRRLKIPEDLFQKLKKEKGTGYIATINGRNMRPDHFGERQLKQFYDHAGVPHDQRLTPHELRHTCGTLLYEETKDIYHVSRFLGHSDIGITTKIYVHSEMQQVKVHIDFE